MKIRLDKKFLALFIVISIIFLLASIYYYHKTVQPDDSISWTDFRVYFYAGFRLAMPEADIYDESHGYFRYKYSPIFALIMSVIKFSTITPPGALRVWYFILFVAFLVSIYLVKEILAGSGTYTPFRFFNIVPFLFIFRYLILINFVHSYFPREWPAVIRIFDMILLYGLGPMYLLRLFFAPLKENTAWKSLISLKNPERNYLIIMLVAILFILRFLVLNIDRSQVNIIILMLLLFFSYCLVNKKEASAGIYLGIAIAFKLTPVIFLIYLLFKKKLKALFSAIVTFAALLILPVFRWGIEHNKELINGWLGALGATLPSEYIQHKNQSLMAAISRLFSGNSDIALLNLSQAHLTALIMCVYAIFLITLVYIIVKSVRRPEGEAVIYDLALFFAVMTVLSPVGTKTTFVYMILPLGLLIKEAFSAGLKNKVINMGLLAYVSLVYLNSSDIIGDLSVTLHKYSLMTLSILIVYALTAYAKFRRV